MPELTIDKYVHIGNTLVRNTSGGVETIPLPDLTGVMLGYWIKPSPFEGTPPWEWVVTNMPVTVVTGMSAGYTFTHASACHAVSRALSFWARLGYDTTKERIM